MLWHHFLKQNCSLEILSILQFRSVWTIIIKWQLFMKLALGNANNFCFLHGRAHIPETLQGALTKETILHCERLGCSHNSLLHLAPFVHQNFRQIWWLFIQLNSRLNSRQIWWHFLHLDFRHFLQFTIIFAKMGENSGENSIENLFRLNTQKILLSASKNAWSL